MSYTDLDYINMEYEGKIMPYISISETDKSQVDNLYINNSYSGKVLQSDTPATSYVFDNMLTFISNEGMLYAESSEQMLISAFDTQKTYKLVVHSNTNVEVQGSFGFMFLEDNVESFTFVTHPVSTGFNYFPNGYEGAYLNVAILNAPFDAGTYRVTLEEVIPITQTRFIWDGIVRTGDVHLTCNIDDETYYYIAHKVSDSVFSTAQLIGKTATYINYGPQEGIMDSDAFWYNTNLTVMGDMPGSIISGNGILTQDGEPVFNETFTFSGTYFVGWGYEDNNIPEIYIFDMDIPSPAPSHIYEKTLPFDVEAEGTEYEVWGCIDYETDYTTLGIEANSYYTLTVDDIVFNCKAFDEGEGNIRIHESTYDPDSEDNPGIVVKQQNINKMVVQIEKFIIPEGKSITRGNHTVTIDNSEAPTLDGTVLVEAGSSYTTRVDQEYFGIDSPTIDIEIDDTLREDWINSLGDYYDGTTQNIILDGVKKSNLTFTDGDDWLYFGNGHLLDSSIEDTGEDFCVSLGDVIFLVTETAGTHTFGLAYQVVNE